MQTPSLLHIPFPLWNTIVPPKPNSLQRRQCWVTLLVLNSTIRKNLLALFFEKIDPLTTVLPLIEGSYAFDFIGSTVDFFLKINVRELLAYTKSITVLRVEMGKYNFVKEDTEIGWKVGLEWEGKKIVWKDASALPNTSKWLEEEEKQWSDVTVDQLPIIENGNLDSIYDYETPLVSLEFQRFPRLLYPLKYYNHRYDKVKDFSDRLNCKKVHHYVCGRGWGFGEEMPPISEDVMQNLRGIAKNIIEKIPRGAPEYYELLLNMSGIIEDIGTVYRATHSKEEIQQNFISWVSNKFPQLHPYLSASTNKKKEEK